MFSFPGLNFTQNWVGRGLTEMSMMEIVMDDNDRNENNVKDKTIEFETKPPHWNEWEAH